MTVPTMPRNGQPAPETVYGYVSAESQGGVPMTEAISFESARPFHASEGTRERAKEYVRAAGLTVTAESRLGFTVCGTPAAYEQLTSGRLETYEARQRVEMNRVRSVTHLDIVGKRQPDALGIGAVPGEDAIEAVALEQPRTPTRVLPAAAEPPVDAFHLTLPDDVATLLSASQAHDEGEVGRGVQVAMVDTGQSPHAYFAAHVYDIAPTVAVVPRTNANEDPVGHGTGESANIFAVAPGARLHPYRASDRRGNLTAAVTGLVRAKSDNPQVLTNSWGGDIDDFPPQGPPAEIDVIWALEILDAVEQGIVVVFSAGNGQFSIEPQVPGVLTVGGVFAGPGRNLRASNYTSGYISPWFDGVVVPGVSGLVGMLPRAQYLMLPVPPGCEIDVTESQADVDDPLSDPGDGTSPEDGWALFSGTSAAAPQIAGAAAVLLGARPGLTSAQVAEALAKTATDITAGSCHPRFGHRARRGPDEATGAGLVNVDAALTFARTQFPQ